MNRLKFWGRVTWRYIRYGFPLKALLNDEPLEIGFRNRGLLAYANLSAYEPELKKLIASVNSESIFIDVGANIGLMSKLASLNEHFVEIISIEPSSSFKQLNENVSSKVQCMNVALIDAFESGQLITEKNAARDHIEPINETENGSSLLKSTDLLKTISENDKDLIVKVDIEGAERYINWSVWMNSTLLKMLMIEVWDESLLNSLQELAKSLGFSSSLYDSRFEHKTNTFSEPVNLVLERVK